MEKVVLLDRVSFESSPLIHDHVFSMSVWSKIPASKMISVPVHLSDGQALREVR